MNDVDACEPFCNALVGRFAFNNPPMDAIHKFFMSLDFKGDCSVGLLDATHILIQSFLEENYTRIFVCRIWFTQSSPMIVSK